MIINRKGGWKSLLCANQVNQFGAPPLDDALCQLKVKVDAMFEL